MANAETIWRCAKCGKWSHAKRRPTKHQRWVNTGTKTVTEIESWDTGALIEVDVPDGHHQPCGPFLRWVATRTERPPLVVTVELPGISR